MFMLLVERLHQSAVHFVNVREELVIQSKMPINRSYLDYSKLFNWNGLSWGQVRVAATNAKFPERIPIADSTAHEAK